MSPAHARFRPENDPESPAYEETILFASPLVRLGAFRCRPHYPDFADTGPIHAHLVVFPRTPVLITHTGGPRIVADPCTVMFYNRAQTYRREEISERGDLCEWLAFDKRVLVEALRPFDPRAADRDELPFSLTHGPSDSRTYYLQRRLAAALERDLALDPLLVEEVLLRVLGLAVSRAHASRRRAVRPRRASTVRAHRDLVEDTKSLLSSRYGEDLRLSEIARLVNSSPYHLGRIFRAAVGTTLHAYRDQMRLRVSLERILDGCDDLSRLAHEVGYSSHSHFSAAFGRVFGVPPSAAREVVPPPALGNRAGF